MTDKGTLHISIFGVYRENLVDLFIRVMVNLVDFTLKTVV